MLELGNEVYSKTSQTGRLLPCNLVHIYIVYCSILQEPEKSKERVITYTSNYILDILLKGSKEREVSIHTQIKSGKGERQRDNS